MNGNDGEIASRDMDAYVFVNFLHLSWRYDDHKRYNALHRFHHSDLNRYNSLRFSHGRNTTWSFDYPRFASSLVENWHLSSSNLQLFACDFSLRSHLWRVFSDQHTDGSNSLYVADVGQSGHDYVSAGIFDCSYLTLTYRSTCLSILATC